MCDRPTVALIVSSIRCTPVEEAVVRWCESGNATLFLIRVSGSASALGFAERSASIVREFSYPGNWRPSKRISRPKWTSQPVADLPEGQVPALLIDCRWDPRAEPMATEFAVPVLQLRISQRPWRDWGRREALQGVGWCPFRVVYVAADGAERVLKQGAYATRWSPRATARSIADRASEHMAVALSEALSGTPSGVSPDSRCDPSAAGVGELPGLLRIIRESVELPFTERARRRAPWHLGVVDGSWRVADLTDARDISNPPDGWLADPHWCVREGLEGIFAEQWDEAEGRGHIVWMPWNQGSGGSTTKVIGEPWHLSFPSTFDVDGRLYMTLESGDHRSVCIYECQEFPTAWRLHHEFLTGVEAVDPIVVRHGQDWFLLVNIDSLAEGEPGNELHVFVADDPLAGEWQPLVGNPQVMDPRCARNGGAFVEDGQLYRVAQEHGFRTYGQACSVMRVEQLDRSGFRETFVRRFGLADGRGPHTLTGTETMLLFDVHDLGS